MRSSRSATAIQSKFPGKRIVSQLELVREVKGARTIAEWKAAQPDPANANPRGLFEAEGKLWKSITEIDNMVVEPGAGGKLKPTYLEQVKTGAADSPTEATGENARVIDALKEIAGGNGDVQIFDKTSKNKLGTRRTGEYALDAKDLQNVDQKTRGLPGKPGFDETLGIGSGDLKPAEARTILEGLARQLVEEGLPKYWTPTVVTPTSKDPNEKK